MKVSDFHYHLPAGAVSQTAIEPRHSSRLLDTRDMTDHLFLDLPRLLRPGDVVIVNNTRVRAARIEAVRAATGGKVEFLFLGALADGTWQALAKPARRLRPGVELDVDGARLKVVANLGGGLVHLGAEVDDMESLLARSGSVPLPPYFVGGLADPERYQTIYAQQPGSVAAPTAGLHFTDEVFKGLKEIGVEVASIELHVSLDTFRPMDVENVDDHRMHSEWCEVSDDASAAVARCRDHGGRVVAIGTTVVRTLESFADGSGGVEAGSGPTDIFLRPGQPINVVDLLVTNFHLPGSTLLVLLEAFMGRHWRDAYESALARGFRFLSFGDAMLCERA